MPHIHEYIDLTIAAYVVHHKNVLFVHHKKLNKWLPPGGHVELDQDPEEALYAELLEETGLTPAHISICGHKPEITSPGTKFLHTPAFLDIHDISDTHKHIGITYIVQAKTDHVLLSEREHNHIRWFSLPDLDDPLYQILPAVKYYATEAIKRVSESH